MLLNFSLLNGYVIKKSLTKCDLETAFRVLKSDILRQSFIGLNTAKDTTTLETARWKCPYCQTVNPLHSDKELSHDDIKAIENKVYNQFSLLDKPDFSVKFIDTNNEILTCRHCSSQVYPERGTPSELSLSFDDNILKLSFHITNILELLESEMIDGDITELIEGLPLRESAVFDFNSGKYTQYRSV